MESAWSFWIPAWGAAAIALAVAAADWNAARPLLAAPEGPALTERIRAWRHKHRFLAAVGFVALLWSGRHAVWAMPLAWLGLLVTSHRVGRVVLGDTWSLAAHVRWAVRAFLGMSGFWWAVALAPLLLTAAGAPAWIVLATGALLLAWHVFYGDVLRVALGATVVDRPDLLAAFAPILTHARVPHPELICAGPPGARLVNAFAVPGLLGHRVLFFRGLLDRTTPAEAAAILAHEVAHLEDYARRRLQVHGLGALLVAGATVVGLAAALGAIAPAAAFAWFVVAIVSMLVRVAHRQRRESESDLRAVELCADGEALVRALVGIHTAMLVPRRLAADLERQASHPSLARRIQAIRAKAGVLPPIVGPRAFAGDGIPRAVVFGVDRLAFVTQNERADLQDVAGLLALAQPAETAAYTDLTEIRLEPGGSGAVLVAFDRNGGRHRMPIASADAGAVEALLDLVDQRLAPIPPNPGQAAPVGRIAAAVVFLAAWLPPTGWTVMAAAVVAMIRPGARLLAAVSAAACTSSLLIYAFRGDGRTAWFLAMSGVLCAGVARLRWPSPGPLDPPPDPAFADGLILALGAAGSLALLAAVGWHDAGALHASARALPIAAPGCIALAVWLAFGSSIASRAAAALVALVALAAGIVGSTPFRNLAAPDPLIARAPPLRLQDLPAPVHRFTLPAEYHTVALSPDARHVLLRSGHDPLNRRNVVASTTDGWQRTIDGDSAFLDAGTLLIARHRGDGSEVVAAETLREGRRLWQVTVDDPPYGPIAAGTDGRWWIDPDEQGPKVRILGHGGDASLRRVPAAGVWWDGNVVTAADGAGLVAYSVPRAADTGLARAAGAETWDSVVRRTGSAPKDLVHSRLRVSCTRPPAPAPVDPPAATCFASTSDETWIWEVDVSRGTLRPIAHAREPLMPTRLDGPMIGAWWLYRPLLVLWRGTPQGYRLRQPDDLGRQAADFAAGRLATLESDQGASVVSIYAIASPTASAAVD